MALAAYGWEVAEEKDNYTLIRKKGTKLAIPVSKNVMELLEGFGASHGMSLLDMYGEFFHRFSKAAYSKGEKLMETASESGWKVEKGDKENWGEAAEEHTIFEYPLSPTERIWLHFSSKFGSERYKDGVVDIKVNIAFKKNEKEMGPYDIMPEEETKIKNKLDELLKSIGE